MTKWFIKKDGRLFGPFNDDQIQELAENESIDSDTLVRRGAHGQWKLARHIAGLLPGFEDTDVRVPAMLREVPSDNASTMHVDAPAEPPQLFDLPAASQADASTTDELLSSAVNEPDASAYEESTARQPAKRVPSGRPKPVAVPPATDRPMKTPRSRPPNARKRCERPNVVAASEGPGGPFGTHRVIAAMLTCVLPGSGHMYVGRKQLGMLLLVVIPLVYVVFWAGGSMLVKTSIHAEPSVISTTMAEGRLVADDGDGGYSMSLIIFAVLTCFLAPVLLHCYTVIHVVDLAVRDRG